MTKEISTEETDGPKGRHIADNAKVGIAIGAEETLKSKPAEKKAEPKKSESKTAEPEKKDDDK